MGYVVGLGMQNPELKKKKYFNRTSVAEIWMVNIQEINNFGNNFLFIFFIFVKVQWPIWRLIIYA